MVESWKYHCDPGSRGPRQSGTQAVGAASAADFAAGQTIALGTTKPSAALLPTTAPHAGVTEDAFA
jgi:hypothetical protein